MDSNHSSLSTYWDQTLSPRPPTILSYSLQTAKAKFLFLGVILASFTVRQMQSARNSAVKESCPFTPTFSFASASWITLPCSHFGLSNFSFSSYLMNYFTVKQGKVQAQKMIQQGEYELLRENVKPPYKLFPLSVYLVPPLPWPSTMTSTIGISFNMDLCLTSVCPMEPDLLELHF